MKLAEYVIDFLVQRGLRQIFLLPGGGCMHLCDAVGKRKELSFTCCLHEQACALAAEAYGEYTNELGCALVTTGPGGTNAVTGVACAWVESSPCLFISGQAKRSDLIGNRDLRSMGPQEIDIVSVVRSITKYSTRIMDPNSIRYELEKAINIAKSCRKGPVWIDIPLDVQAAEIDVSRLSSYTDQCVATRDYSHEINRCVEALRSARRPVIYAGNGIRAAGVEKLFRKLCDELGVPILLSWKAADLLPDDHPCYVGRPGGIGQRAANFTQQKADWLLILGSRLDLPTVAFNHAEFAQGAFKTIIDVDEAEIAKFDMQLDVKITEDLARIFPLLADALVRSKPKSSEWLERCRGWVRKYPVILPEYREVREFVSTYVLIDVLSKHALSSDVIVPGSSGPCSDILMQAWRIKDGQRVLNAPGLGAMGTGLPGAIGACLASGRARTINVNGDGGFQLNIQELETVRRLNLPIKFFVLDNAGYLSISAMQRNHFAGRLVASDPSSGLTLPDVGKVAAAYGIKTFQITSHEELDLLVGQVLDSAGPAICIVKTSPLEITAPRATSELRTDGTVVTLPMEDLAPRLSREELAAIMAE